MVGFEPTTNRFAVEVTLIYTTDRLILGKIIMFVNYDMIDIDDFKLTLVHSVVEVVGETLQREMIFLLILSLKS